MIDDAFRRNTSALERLADHELFAAQELFRKNIRNAPCWASYQNLGVFYGEEGVMKRNQRGISADMLAMVYLNRALSYRQHELTYLALGQCCFRRGRFREAAKMYSAAYTDSQQWITAYNCGVCNYMNRDYSAAIDWFECSEKLAPDDSKKEIWSNLAFSVLFLRKTEKEKELNAVREKISDRSWESFVLAGLSGQMETAASLADAVWEKYSLGFEELALLFACLAYAGRKSQMEQYFLEQKARYEGSAYPMRKEISALRRIFLQEDVRATVIRNYRPKRALIYQCCYAGCERHQNPFF